jgi:hypothetical protein
MEDDDFDSPPPARATLFFLPLITALGSLAIGVAFGFGVSWMTTSEVIVEVPRDYTADELAAVCKPLMLETAEELDSAQIRVTNLESQVTMKEDRIASMEQEMTDRATRGAAYVAGLKQELEQAREQLVTLQVQLDQALDEKEELMVRLVETEEELEEQKEETRTAKQETLDQRWESFTREAQLEVCERGNRKRLGKCRESIQAAMTEERRETYLHCLRSDQAEPVVHEAIKKEPLPAFAEYLNEDDRIVKGWYVHFCDPSLPEATDLTDYERNDF